MRHKFAPPFLAALLLAATSFVPSRCYAAPIGISLPGNYVQKKGKVTCGFVNPKWEAGQLRKGLFTSFSASMADLKKQLKKAEAKKRSAINKQIAQLKEKRVTQNKQVCSKLRKPAAPTPTPSPTPTAAPFSSLKKIPATARLVQANATGLSAAAVSGQPPALIDIPGMDVKSLYWQAGLIDSIINSTASANQCHDFWFGDQDGESGGMNACNMTGQMGYTFSPIMSAGVTLCHLQAMPNAQLFATGGIELAGGAASVEDPLALLDAGQTSKVVKLSMVGPQPRLMFVRVYSAAQNAQDGYQYHAEAWQCGGQSNQAILSHSVVVTNDNQYLYSFRSHEDNFSAGGYQFLVDASVALDGEGVPRFDLTKDRHAVAEHLDASGSFGFRQDIRITPDNLLKVKSRWLFDYGWRSDYIVSRFSGNNIKDLRLREGAIKAEDHNDGEPQFDSLNAVEYREPMYLSAPENSLVAQVSEINFAADQFFTASPSVQIDTSNFLCDVQPDVSLIVHTDNADVAAAFSSCDQYTIWDTNFCAQDQQINQAKQQWGGFCPAVMAPG